MERGGKVKGYYSSKKEDDDSKVSEHFKVRAQHCKISRTIAHLHRKEQQLY
jgi:hypothetical protein